MEKTYPLFHFRPKSNWINDPNGTIYYQGYYHLFYQYNPDADYWANLHWGHARTKDFIQYEVLPIGLHPQKDRGEYHCFSGCAGIGKNGAPIALYTSVGEAIDESPNIQKAAIFDKDFIQAQTERVDVLKLDMHGLPKVRNDWRDPYIFTTDDRIFLILGGAVGNRQISSVLLFENPSKDLLHWEYRKVLTSFEHYYQMCECPNFFQLGDKFVLVCSPYKEVEYHIGTFNTDTLDFTIEDSGLVDYCAQFYATNTILDDKGRTLLFAFLRGFSKEQGWNNCISLPREVSTNAKGELIQRPIKETAALRKKLLIDQKEKQDTSQGLTAIIPELMQSEISFCLHIDDGKKISLVLKTQDEIVFTIIFSSSMVSVDAVYIPIGNSKDISVQIFIDHSILEIFINDGEKCCTRVKEVLVNTDRFEFRGIGEVENLQVYAIDALEIIEKGIWL